MRWPDDFINQIIHGDCFDIMPLIPDGSIDMILCDMPYGTTACKWDTVLDLEKLWKEYKRIIKLKGAIVLTASQPFTTTLINSARDIFKYELIWDKTFGRQPQLANIQPMKRHENILIFGKSKIIYNKQLTKLEKPYKSSGASNNDGSRNDHKLGLKKLSKIYTHKTPDSILKFIPPSNANKINPTQKPIDLFSYLIKTYTNKEMIVLDNCAGSMTTAIACIDNDRKYICIEKDETYYKIGKKRVDSYRLRETKDGTKYRFI